jgi:hypothetical protein
MHVGGAALDACLALTAPFALVALLAARSRAEWALGAAALGLGAYATLATFSRADYVAIPLGLALTGLLQALQRRHAGGGDRIVRAMRRIGHFTSPRRCGCRRRSASD